MNVVHLTSVHPRYDTRVFRKECRSLAAAGYDVTLVVADGEGNERCDDIHIIDVGKSGCRASRMLRTVDKICRVAVQLHANLYHLHDPELLRIAGKLCKVGNGARVVFDAHEDLPRQILSKQWIPAPFRCITSWGAELVENRVVSRLNGVVAATPHIAERFRKINAHTVDVNNYPIPDELTISDGTRVRRRQICYVGGITRIRGIEPLMHALPRMPDVKLILCGRFDDNEFERAMRALPGWAQVDYRGQVDREGVRRVLSESVAGVVTFLPVPNHVDAQPNKMFEYMSAELPVIASDFPLWRQIIEGVGAGLCVNPQSPEAIAAAVRRLLGDAALRERMGKAGRKAVLEKYNWPREARKLVEFYKELP